MLQPGLCLRRLHVRISSQLGQTGVNILQGSMLPAQFAVLSDRLAQPPSSIRAASPVRACKPFHTSGSLKVRTSGSGVRPEGSDLSDGRSRARRGPAPGGCLHQGGSRACVPQRLPGHVFTRREAKPDGITDPWARLSRLTGTLSARTIPRLNDRGWMMQRLRRIAEVQP